MQNYFSGKTVLVTGAAGFIGSHLVDRLLAQDAEVIGVDNLLSGSRDNLAHISSEQPFTFIQADVAQPVSAYLKSNNKIDLVLHFASPASPPIYQAYPVETYLVNSIATHYLLSFIKESQPRARFLFASTSEIYGDPEIHPQHEDYWGNVNPNGLRSCYDESKRLGESITGVFQRDYNIDTRLIRIFNTYGPRIDLKDGRVIPSFLSSALRNEPYTVYGDGSQTRSYCYVDDLVEGILRMAASDQASGKTVNLGNPGEYTIMQTAHELHKIVTDNQYLSQSDVPITYHPLPKDDPTRRRPDITRAKELLDWEPTVSFAEGLKKTLEYFRTNNH